jgi:hypothetical protein
MESLEHYSLVSNLLECASLNVVEAFLKKHGKLVYPSILSNSNVTLEFIKEYKLLDDYNFEENWDYDSNGTEYLMDNPNITIKMIEDDKYIKKHVDFYSYCGNLNITMNNVLKYPKDKWDICRLSKNLSITLEDIYEHYEIKWSLEDLAERLDITPSFINIMYERLKYQIHTINLNLLPHIKHADVKISEINMNEFEQKILQNAAFKFEDLFKLNIDINRNAFAKFSHNPNLTYEIIKDNSDIKWNFNLISMNQFTLDSEYIKAQQIKLQRKCKYDIIVSYIELFLIRAISQLTMEYIMFI